MTLFPGFRKPKTQTPKEPAMSNSTPPARDEWYNTPEGRAWETQRNQHLLESDLGPELFFEREMVRATSQTGDPVQALRDLAQFEFDQRMELHRKYMAMPRVVQQPPQPEPELPQVDEKLVTQVVKAWMDPGIRPDIHDRAKTWLHQNWYTLYEAVAALAADRMSRPDTEPTVVEVTPDVWDQAEDILDGIYSARAIMRELRDSMGYRSRRGEPFEGQRPWLDHPLWQMASKRLADLGFRLQQLGVK